MKVFAISDLHLSFSSDKPMDIFGIAWEDYWNKIVTDWQARVSDEDIVLIAGDISWAMTLENAIADFEEIKKLKGKKVIIRGNHDYWWSSYSKVKNALSSYDIYAIQNNSLRIGEYVFCGTRGWTISENADSEDDMKIYKRELLRLEMSLKDAVKHIQESDKLIALLHYPPFEAKLESTGITDLLEQYKVDKVVYGHLHGDFCRAVNVVEKNGIVYYLTSCDKINNTLVQIY